MRIDWESLLVALAVMLLMLLVVMALVPGLVRAETCMNMTVQPDQVIGNYDGDTFTVSLGALGEMIVRVQDIDTPERNKKQPGWEEAEQFTQEWLAAGPFDLWTCFAFTFGRVVAVASRDGVTLAAALEAAGYAKE